MPEFEEKRMFGGREFTFWSYYTSHDMAKQVARVFKGEGYYTRVVDTTDNNRLMVCELWIRPHEKGHTERGKRR